MGVQYSYDKLVHKAPGKAVVHYTNPRVHSCLDGSIVYTIWILQMYLSRSAYNLCYFKKDIKQLYASLSLVAWSLN